MSPFSFEWQWNIEYLIFMGFLYIVLVVVACGLTYCLVKTWLDLESTQEDLPPKIPYRSRYSDY